LKYNELATSTPYYTTLDIVYFMMVVNRGPGQTFWMRHLMTRVYKTEQYTKAYVSWRDRIINQ